MVPLERAMVVSYRLSIVTIALSPTILATVCHQMSPPFKSTLQGGWVNLGHNLVKKGLTDVSQILTQSGRDCMQCIGLLYAKEIESISSAI